MRDMSYKKEFAVNDRIYIAGFPANDPIEGARGTILGKSNEYFVDFYIVLLDNPFPKARALVVIETCLERLK